MIPAAAAAVLDAVRVAPDRRTASFGAWKLTATETRDLEKRLGHALYEHLHLRRERPVDTRARMVREPAFEERLRTEVPTPHVLLPAAVVDQRDGDCLVQLMGVRVWVPADRVTPDQTRVRLSSAHAALSPGFLLVQGPMSPASLPRHRLRRIYLNPLDADAAVTVWGVVLRVVQRHVPSYRAKAASVRWFYPRTDAITVYVADDALETVIPPLVAALDDPRLLGPTTSVLCEPVAPGIAVAAEPVDTSPGRTGLSFGEHRASLLARAVVLAAQTGSTWRNELPAILAGGQVDAAALWRNAPHDPISVAAAGIAPPTEIRREVNR